MEVVANSDAAVGSPFSEDLQRAGALDRLRSLNFVVPAGVGECVVNGRTMVNFAGNDYLALSQHEVVKQRSIEYIQKYGAGAAASRLLSGNIEPYARLEKKLACLKGSEDALILPTGFQANSTVLSALAKRASWVACDRLSHKSILEGVSKSDVRWFRYGHNDLTDLQRRADRVGSHSGRQQSINLRWIVTESVFSMDGDCADLDSLSGLATKYGALLYVDEAHATGVIGRNGMGASAGRGDVAVSMGTFGKACGSFGAYIACSRELKDYLINFCSGFIFSTALPPAVLGAIDAALDLIPEMDAERTYLFWLADQLRSGLSKLGFETAGSTTQIVPIIMGSERDALDLSRYLSDAGMYCPAIRPPTVPDGESRVRISLTTGHTGEHVDNLLKQLALWHEKS